MKSDTKNIVIIIILFLFGIAIFLHRDPESTELVFALLSLAMSFLAIHYAFDSDRKMRAIAYMQYDEKLAIMAQHINDMEQAIKDEIDIETERKEDSNNFTYKKNHINKFNESLYLIQRFKNDLTAIFHLLGEIEKSRVNELVQDRVIPFVEKSIECKMMGEHKKRMEELRRIISLAIKYNVDIERLNELYGKTEP